MAKIQLLLTTILLSIINYTFSVAHNITDEVVEESHKQELVNSYNKFHKSLYPKASKLEVRLKSDGNIGVFALANIKVYKN